LVFIDEDPDELGQLFKRDDEGPVEFAPNWSQLDQALRLEVGDD
jgi:hypothetical protein